MATNSPLLFALHDNQAYAALVAARLGLPLAAVEERVYEDGEHKSWPVDEVDGRRVVLFASLHSDAELSANDKLCRLMFFCCALKDAGASQVQVVAPYLCYTRKERRTHRQDAVINRYVAMLLEATGVDRLMTLEVHDAAAFDNAFRIPTQHLDSTELFAEHFAGLADGTELVAVSPDMGGIKRAERFRSRLEQRLGRPVASACVEKHRNNDVVTGGGLLGSVRGKTAIIVDDLISTGSTLLQAGKACQKAGAIRLFAAAAHGLFTGGSALLDSPLFERIVICDSVPPFRLAPEVAAQRLEILGTSALVAARLVQSY
ncbi:ribose-phosphate diphosphokinase [Metapseudomonas boanensis]|uniref:ribose-phosphate diphosphokinase n=1 Tax=Metapseudomonas boanensis TaxID=2822138 RepID=A0ABS5XLA4_9GAMM|nr:ribose-phosphate diphosphokinase [Pseudomonas boanensis]MBT8768475.1 ribose-phosphate pyrophosphokinase [Pseudomonas boanensis]